MLPENILWLLLFLFGSFESIKESERLLYME